MPRDVGFYKAGQKPAGGNPIAKGMQRAMKPNGTGGKRPRGSMGGDGPTPKMMKRAMQSRGF